MESVFEKGNDQNVKQKAYFFSFFIKWYKDFNFYNMITVEYFNILEHIPKENDDNRLIKM